MALDCSWVWDFKGPSEPLTSLINLTPHTKHLGTIISHYIDHKAGALRGRAELLVFLVFSHIPQVVSSAKENPGNHTALPWELDSLGSTKGGNWK